MQTPGPLEIIVILVVALLVFGPTKLPEIGRQFGRAMREFKRFQGSFQDEVKDFLDPKEKPESKPEPPASGWPAHMREAAPPPPSAPEVIDVEPGRDNDPPAGASNAQTS